MNHVHLPQFGLDHERAYSLVPRQYLVMGMVLAVHNFVCFLQPDQAIQHSPHVSRHVSRRFAEVLDQGQDPVFAAKAFPRVQKIHNFTVLHCDVEAIMSCDDD
jgi:hypothetical protein